MKDFILNLLPRIKQYSKSLDEQELFVDQPWVLIDEKGNKQQYIFRRDGRLMMALNGVGQEGKWELIPSAQSMWIDKGTEKLLLNHAFFNRGIMLLRRDGVAGEMLVLANPNVVPELDVVKYLQSYMTLSKPEDERPRLSNSIQPQIANIGTSEGFQFVHHSGEIYDIPDTEYFSDADGKRVFHHGKVLPDGTYLSKDDRIIKVVDGYIKHSGFLVTISTPKGRFHFVTDRTKQPKEGDFVFKKTWGDVFDDSISFMNSTEYTTYIVLRGKIIDVRKRDLVIIGAITIVVFLILLAVIVKL